MLLKQEAGKFLSESPYKPRKTSMLNKAVGPYHSTRSTEIATAASKLSRSAILSFYKKIIILPQPQFS